MRDQTDVRDQEAHLLLNARRLRTGVLLALAGASIGVIGSLLTGIELAVATRRWLADSGQPPSELAKVKMRQALSASHAAAEAWHRGTDRVEIAEGAAAGR